MLSNWTDSLYQLLQFCQDYKFCNIDLKFEAWEAIVDCLGATNAVTRMPADTAIKVIFNADMTNFYN